MNIRLQHPPLVVAPVLLEGQRVRLEPLTLAHLPGLCAVGLDRELWRLATTYITTDAGMRAYVEAALQAQQDGTMLPFATIERTSGQVIGSTRFGNIDRANRHVEIGWTWLGQPWQRTAINTEAKYLMLRQAFETWGCLRVEWKTDVLNERSRNAILRIGATEEGTFRKHIITDTGRLRDSVYFSMLDTEWPDRKSKLEAKLAARL